MAEIRVRFAPSPTGFFHIGSARTALFNWLYARHTGGTFILRIEDTDAERNTPEALRVLLEGMRWLGMDWDEGPDVGGRYGPYFQSERGSVYAGYRQRLLDGGRAYEKEGAVWFRLLGERYQEYDEYLKAEVEKVRAQPVVIRDAIRGEVTRAEERDFVLFRSDGAPTFHFVNVVDDIAMGITHVIRGEDHLSNTSKHIELFQAFGVQPPFYAHLPLILKDPEQGKGKMSKRDKGALIEEYRERSFLPAAVRNYIALLGWNPKEEGKEVMDIGEIIERFDIKDIQKGAARFDEKKMAYINQEHLKALPVTTYAWHARPVLTAAGVVGEDVDEDYLQRVLALCQPKVDALENLPGFCAYFFRDDFARDEAAAKKLEKKDPQARIREALVFLEPIAAEEWTEAALEAAFQDLATAHHQEKPYSWWPPIRYALSGVLGGPDFVPMLAIMGKERVMRRLGA